MFYLTPSDARSMVVAIHVFGYKLGLALRAAGPLRRRKRLQVGWIACVDEQGVQSADCWRLYSWRRWWCWNRSSAFYRRVTWRWWRCRYGRERRDRGCNFAIGWIMSRWYLPWLCCPL